MTGDFYRRLVARFSALEAELNELDAATGDGDHGSTMLRGLRAATEGGGARAFRETSGGASGTLFAALFGALEAYLSERHPLGDTLGQAAERVTRLGQAKPGDKTMLDALVPAAEAAAADPEAAREAAAKAAVAGAQATVAMAAKRGRARYVEAGGAGHMDAGARSVAVILSELAAIGEGAA